MLDDPDHDHDARANGDRPRRADCSLHDPLAITPADAPRREVLVALAEAEASPLRGLGALLGMRRGEGGAVIQHGDRVLVTLRGQENPAHDGPWWAQDGDWTRPTTEEQIAISRAKDRAEADPEDAEAVKPPPAAYVWRVRDLAAPDAVTRYTLGWWRDLIALAKDAHDDRRRFVTLEGAPLGGDPEFEELAAGDVAATPEVLADVQRMLEDTAPEGHEVDRVEAEPSPKAGDRWTICGTTSTIHHVGIERGRAVAFWDAEGVNYTALDVLARNGRLESAKPLPTVCRHLSISGLCPQCQREAVAAMSRNEDAAEPPPTVPRPARQEPETTLAALAHLDRVRLRRGQEPTAGPRMAWVAAEGAPTARTMLALGFTTDELLEAIRSGALLSEVGDDDAELPSKIQARRIAVAADIAHRYGGIEEAHHKQWVIDQMLRAMLGEDAYRAWVAVQNVMRELKEARDDTGRERELRCALHIAVRDFIANPRKNAAALADQHPDIAAALAGSMPPPAPPLPPGSHGVTMRVLSVDPPVALLEFEPGGVLGEDVHPEHDEMITLIGGSIDVIGELWGRRPLAHDTRRALSVTSRLGHELRAGTKGAVVLVAMVVP